MTDTEQRIPLPEKRLSPPRAHMYINLPLAIFTLISFVCLFVFYSKVHPLYIHDLDDWLYIFYPRAGYPDITEWNPTKVLPETWMPLISYIGVYFFYPITGDYTQALCDAYAIFLSGMIVVYLLLAARILKKRFQLNNLTITLLTSLFFLGHFLPFLTQESENLHLFWSMNVTCIFNYLVPALWNYILCFYFLSSEKTDWNTSERSIHTGLIITAVYLAIFSSLWHSVILMSLFGTRLLFALIIEIKNNRAEGNKVTLPFLLKYAHRHLPKLLALCAWFLAMAMELVGPRATVSSTGNFLLGTSVMVCLDTVFGMNRGFLISVVGINFLSLVIAVFRLRKNGERDFLLQQLEIAFSMLLCGTFIVLVAAKVSPGYLPRADVMISWMLWLMLMTICSLAYLVKVQPKLLWMLPVCLYVLFFEAVFHRQTFAENYVYNQTPAIVKAVNEDIVKQVLAADQAGEHSVEVHIPVNGSDGWPLDTVLTPDRIGRALYYHNLTQRQMEVTLIPDPAKDIELNVLP